MIYDTIGKLLVHGTWIAAALILISLFFGYLSLTKKIYFYSTFSGILDFFYMPLKTIYAHTGKEKALDKVMVSLKNKANEVKFRKTKKRILLAPHCMRHIDCPAKGTRTGIQCLSCGRCPYTEIKEKAEKNNIRLFILTGSSAVKHIVKSEKFDGILLLACPYELNKVMRSLAPYDIISYGVPLTKDGCYDTKTDLGTLYDTMKMRPGKII